MSASTSGWHTPEQFNQSREDEKHHLAASAFVQQYWAAIDGKSPYSKKASDIDIFLQQHALKAEIPRERYDKIYSAAINAALETIKARDASLGATAYSDALAYVQAMQKRGLPARCIPVYEGKIDADCKAGVQAGSGLYILRVEIPGQEPVTLIGKLFAHERQYNETKEAHQLLANVNSAHIPKTLASLDDCFFIISECAQGNPLFEAIGMKEYQPVIHPDQGTPLALRILTAWLGISTAAHHAFIRQEKTVHNDRKSLTRKALDLQILGEATTNFYSTIVVGYTPQLAQLAQQHGTLSEQVYYCTTRLFPSLTTLLPSLNNAMIHLDSEPKIVTHNDLHFGNILLAKDGKIIFVDFERTRLGNVHTDIVELLKKNHALNDSKYHLILNKVYGVLCKSHPLGRSYEKNGESAFVQQHCRVQLLEHLCSMCKYGRMARAVGWQTRARAFLQGQNSPSKQKLWHSASVHLSEALNCLKINQIGLSETSTLESSIMAFSEQFLAGHVKDLGRPLQLKEFVPNDYKDHPDITANKSADNFGTVLMSSVYGKEKRGLTWHALNYRKSRRTIRLWNYATRALLAGAFGLALCTSYTIDSNREKLQKIWRTDHIERQTPEFKSRHLRFRRLLLLLAEQGQDMIPLQKKFNGIEDKINQEFKREHPDLTKVKELIQDLKSIAANKVPATVSRHAEELTQEFESILERELSDPPDQFSEQYTELLRNLQKSNQRRKDRGLELKEHQDNQSEDSHDK